MYAEFADTTHSLITHDTIEYTGCDEWIGCSTIIIPTTTNPAVIKSDLISGGYVAVGDTAQ